MKLGLVLVLVCCLAVFSDAALSKKLSRHRRNANMQPQEGGSKPMRKVSWTYRGPKSSQAEIQNLIDSLPSLTLPPMGGYAQRVFKIRNFPVITHQPVIVEEPLEIDGEPAPPAAPEPEPFSLLQKLLKQTTGRLGAVQQTGGSCAWDSLGTQAATNLINAAMEERGGDYKLINMNKRMESISTRCEVDPSSGENSCNTDHKITISFIIGESTGLCSSKCSCQLADQASTVTCTANADVSETFVISNLELSCDDDEQASGEE